MIGLYGMSYYSTAESLPEVGSAASAQGEDNEQVQGLMRKTSSEDQFENDNESTARSEPFEITQQPIGRRRSILICGKTIPRRQLGLLSALMCGLWGGSCLVPMHYSTGDTNGLGYVISFSIGALGKQKYCLINVWAFMSLTLYLMMRKWSLSSFGFYVLDTSYIS